MNLEGTLDWKSLNQVFQLSSKMQFRENSDLFLDQDWNQALHSVDDEVSYFHQIEKLRKILNPKTKMQFVGIQEFENKWFTHFLPKKFGILLRFRESYLEGKQFFWMLNQGKTEQFFRPDLSLDLGMEHSLKWLRERYWMPVCGLDLNWNDWQDVLKESNPWKRIAFLEQNQKLNFYPKKNQIKFLFRMNSIF